MYKFARIVLILIAISYFFQLYGQSTSPEDNNTSIDKLYKEMTRKDHLFIKKSHIISETLIKEIESISHTPKKETYCDLIRNYLKKGVLLLQKKGLAPKQALLVTTSHLQFIANKYFSIKSMLMIQKQDYNFTILNQHQHKRKLFFEALDCTLSQPLPIS